MNDTTKGYHIETGPVHEVKAAARGGTGAPFIANPELAYPGRKFEPSAEYLARYAGHQGGTNIHEVLCRAHDECRRLGEQGYGEADLQAFALAVDWAWTMYLENIRLEQSLLRMQDMLEEASC